MGRSRKCSSKSAGRCQKILKFEKDGTNAWPLGGSLSPFVATETFQKSSLSTSDFPPPLALAVGADYQLWWPLVAEGTSPHPVHLSSRPRACGQSSGTRTEARRYVTLPSWGCSSWPPLPHLAWAPALHTANVVFCP